MHCFFIFLNFCIFEVKKEIDYFLLLLPTLPFSIISTVFYWLHVWLVTYRSSWLSA